MCKDCGCSLAPEAKSGSEHAHETVTVFRQILDENDRVAAHNREHFDHHRVLAINLMSSPGAGKTSLLERTVELLGERLRIAVIEGDLATENDAARIRARGVPAIQINTGSACHLDAGMVHDALHDLALGTLDLLFIENVGNLVCPASFDLGQHRNVTLLSVPEGDDKPAKYPVMFRAADVVLVSKVDLLPVLSEFELARVEKYLHDIGVAVPMLQVSARRADGLAAWCSWLEAELAVHRRRVEQGSSVKPRLQPEGLHLHSVS